MGYDDSARKQAASLITGWKRPLLISHAKPDGDAVGSMLAMEALLESQGSSPVCLLFEPLPARYAFLVGARKWLVGDSQSAAGVLNQVDAVVILDTCSYSQIEPISDWLKKTRLPKLVIDHHETGDAITTHLLVDKSAAATSLIISELAVSAGWQVSTTAAVGLLVGVSTDTGWFRHSNTDERTLRVAADLLQRGIKAYQLYEELYHRDSVARVRLLGEAISTLTTEADGRLAIMTLRQEAFQRAHATPADTEDIVNEPLRIGSVLVSVLLVDQGDGVTRINFRSKAPDPAGLRPLIDVSAIAREFGGGGHRHAAGARSKASTEQLSKDITSRLAKEWAGC